MTTTTLPDIHSADALALARASYPDAQRATIARLQRHPGRLRGSVVTLGDTFVRVLRARVDDISAMSDGGDRGSNGYRVYLIVSATAATEAQ